MQTLNSWELKEHDLFKWDFSSSWTQARCSMSLTIDSWAFKHNLCLQMMKKAFRIHVLRLLLLWFQRVLSYMRAEDCTAEKRSSIETEQAQCREWDLMSWKMKAWNEYAKNEFKTEIWWLSFYMKIHWKDWKADSKCKERWNWLIQILQDQYKFSYN